MVTPSGAADQRSTVGVRVRPTAVEAQFAHCRRPANICTPQLELRKLLREIFNILLCFGDLSVTLGKRVLICQEVTHG